MRRLPALLLAAAALSCGRAPERLPHRLYVPGVVRSPGYPGRIHWKTTVVVRNEGDVPARVRAFRWPPVARSVETDAWTLAAGASVRIPSLVPALPALSSLTVESDRPVRVDAVVEPRRGEAPSLRLPVVPLDALARPGDRILLGTLRQDDAFRSHIAFSIPWAEHDTVPFKVAVAARRPGDGVLLSRVERTIPGVPSVVEDPWEAFLVKGYPPMDLEVTLLSSGRGRSPRTGLWVYGIEQDRTTLVSRFVTTRVERARR